MVEAALWCEKIWQIEVSRLQAIVIVNVVGISKNIILEVDALLPVLPWLYVDVCDLRDS